MSAVPSRTVGLVLCAVQFPFALPWTLYVFFLPLLVMAWRHGKLSRTATP